MPGMATSTFNNLSLIVELPKDVRLTAQVIYFKFEKLNMILWIPFLLSLSVGVLATYLFVEYVFIPPAKDWYDLARVLTIFFVGSAVGFCGGREVYRKLLNRTLAQIYSVANESLDTQLAFALLVNKVPSVKKGVEAYNIKYVPNIRRPASLKGEFTQN